MDTSRFEQFSALMTSAAKSVSKLKAAQMDAFSLSGAHTNCLCRLHEAGSLTQGELTRLEQMDRSQVSRVLRDLAQKGYVVSDTQAGYKRRYTLTPAGEQTAEHGRWERGPGEKLFTRLREQLPQARPEGLRFFFGLCISHKIFTHFIIA